MPHRGPERTAKSRTPGIDNVGSLTRRYQHERKRNGNDACENVKHSPKTHRGFPFVPLPGTTFEAGRLAVSFPQGNSFNST